MGLNGTDIDTSVRGYSREAVEEFAAAAEREVARLQAEIDATDRRTARARAAIGTHRVMVAMLFTTQHRLDEIRQEAEMEAAAILQRAEHDADNALGGNDRVLDLRAPHEADTSVVTSSPFDERSLVWNEQAPREWSAGPEGAPDYFTFLRGALDDDEPLGPRAD
jgi:hypothetical protein